MMRDKKPGENFLRMLSGDHRPAVLAYAAKLTGNHAVAEDVTQETLLRAWRSREELTGRPGSVRGWLMTVARNIVIDRARARARRPESVAYPEHLSVSDCSEAVSAAVVVRSGLRRLSPDHRDVLFEMYYRHRSVAETSALLNVPVGTVKSRAHYGLRALREQLTEPRATVDPVSTVR
jgi:RNA polymerase sigma-70 factor, ECF subfamily